MRVYAPFWEVRWRTIARLKESVKMVCPGLLSLKAPPQPLVVWETGRSSWDKQRGLFHRKTRICFKLLSVGCPGGGSLPRTVFPIVIAPSDPETQVALVTKAR